MDMTRVHAATNRSAVIMVFFRSQRSINIPAKGPTMAAGSNPAMAPKASTSAEPWVMLSQMMMAKLTAELVIRETNCPIQMNTNFLFQELSIGMSLFTEGVLLH